MNCWICRVTLNGQPGSRIYWLTVLNLLRTSSQSCLTRSEGCRSSPRPKRNDGDGVPPLPWSSALSLSLVFLPHLLFFPSNRRPHFLSFKPTSYFFPSHCCLDPTMLVSRFILVNDPATMTLQYEAMGIFTFLFEF